jgi:NAD(P)-dependent dehydrogenase (short-subunit alcohol dehydrogenase family)
VKGPFLLTGKLLPILNKGASVVNISSGLARFSHPGRAAYASMKGALEVMTRYMAVEFGPLGIRVNTLAPGAIATDFSGGMVRDNPQINAMIAGQTPLGRVGLPDDIGKAIAMLVSDESGWISGQRIEASGGIHS